jgi:2-polyprenyl-3-methyl-5-hydroxy-6-metoxy-1,4-benzoquinol methylase
MTADLGGRCRRSQLVWDQRTVSWHEHVSDTPGFVLVRDTLLRLADCALTDHCVDIGAGTGFVTLAMAAAGADILAVDLSGAMLVELERRALEAEVAVSFRQQDLATAVFLGIWPQPGAASGLNQGRVHD